MAVESGFYLGLCWHSGQGEQREQEGHLLDHVGSFAHATALHSPEGLHAHSAEGALTHRQYRG